VLAFLLACAPTPTPVPASAIPPAVPWTHARPGLDERTPAGRALRRAIVHLHSIYSHDACDNQEMDLDVCMADFRAGLCNAGIDIAFVTDHPAHAAEQTFDDLLLAGQGDQVIDGLANRMACPDGHTVLLLPGIEDEIMPLALDRQVTSDVTEADRIYNSVDPADMALVQAAGAISWQAHTEGQAEADLFARQAAGLRGVEMFNLHAMVDPNKRQDDLGLEPLSYMTGIGPFITMDTMAEPDLSFLAFYEAQSVSLARWDALNQVGFVAGTAGTDAHENSLPMPMSDDERVDSYRRMMSWFGNYVAVDDDAPAAAEAALAAGQFFVAFDALAVPAGFSATYEVGGAAYEFGADAPAGGTLSVTCPGLSARSPADGEHAPLVAATLLKDGASVGDACGESPVRLDDPGVYRVEVTITPEHLRGFLDDQADALVHPYPWLYSNPFRLGL
jgi:hypothetical protein